MLVSTHTTTNHRVYKTRIRTRLHSYQPIRCSTVICWRASAHNLSRRERTGLAPC